MVKPLDLQEQEQLDQLKHFWNKYGNAILWVLIIVFFSIAAFNGWNYWKQRQALSAATLYDAVETASTAKDVEKLKRAVSDMNEQFPTQALTHHANLELASVQYQAKLPDEALVALQRVIDKSPDAGHVAIARIRAAGIQLDKKAFDAAMKLLDASMPASFDALTADRKGDILAAQDKREEAKAHYLKAYSAMDEQMEYRRLIGMKLNGMGVDVAELDKAAKEKAEALSKPETKSDTKASTASMPVVAPAAASAPVAAPAPAGASAVAPPAPAASAKP
jgi:predicted negative regulator of RcsB-dependent stress response